MHRAGMLVAAIAITVGLAACSSPAQPVQKPITQLEVGDCFDTDAAFSIALVQPTCDAPHLYEAFYLERIEGSDFPGDDAVAARADEVCTTQFEAFTGVPVSANAAAASMFLGPTAESWQQDGDRTIVCVAMSIDATPRSGSFGAAGS